MKEGDANFLLNTGRVDGYFVASWVQGLQNIALEAEVGREPVISYALFISINVFMYLQLIFGISASVLAIMNVVKNPTEPMLGLPGVELSSGLSAMAGTISLMIWGIYFAVDLKDHLAFAYIAAQPINYNPALGFSYWLLLPAAVFSMCGLGMIELRRYLLERDPPAPTIQIENHSDGTIFLY
ncbi:hypothetical protein EVAR_8598_1 [Eumeta japonica]|uniref:Uncharacterized protein n=1 Tax=Eumeta variegata TaxID=151549 RepID=A0A4C1XGY7_EUMVA|nr:hypothetical protein EVAR_8598_1 [Eumeta japonica]